MRLTVIAACTCLGLAAAAGARMRFVEVQTDVFEAAEDYAAAVKGAHLTVWEAALVRNNVEAVIARHSFVEQGRTWIGADLEHLVIDHRARRPHEERLSSRHPGRFELIFDGRLEHIRTCPVCASLVRQFTRFMAVTAVRFTPDPDSVAIRPVVLLDDRWIPAIYRRTRRASGFYGDGGTFIGDITFVYSNQPIDRQAFDDIGRSTGWFVEHRGLLLPIHFFDGPRSARKPDAPAHGRDGPQHGSFLTKPAGAREVQVTTLETPHQDPPRGTPPTSGTAAAPAEPPLSLGDVRTHLAGLMREARSMVVALQRTRPGRAASAPQSPSAPPSEASTGDGTVVPPAGGEPGLEDE